MGKNDSLFKDLDPIGGGGGRGGTYLSVPYIGVGAPPPRYLFPGEGLDFQSLFGKLRFSQEKTFFPGRKKYWTQESGRH